MTLRARLANAFTFAGQQTDPSGLQYLRARYYDPSTGRFMSRDNFGGFAGQTQGLNRFAYTMGDPIALTDPTGYGCGIFSVVCNIGNGIVGALSGAPPQLGCAIAVTGDVGLVAGLVAGVIVFPEGVVAAGLTTGGAVLGEGGAILGTAAAC